MPTEVAYLADPARKPPGWQPDWPTGQDQRGAYSQNPQTREKWYPHPEDTSHWDHYDSDRGKRFPQEAKKPWRGQKRLRKGQSLPPLSLHSINSFSTRERQRGTRSQSLRRSWALPLSPCVILKITLMRSTRLQCGWRENSLLFLTSRQSSFSVNTQMRARHVA